MSEERLQKVLAAAGIASRRRAERLILEGRVSVNGRVVRSMGNKVETDHDRIVVDGKVVRVPEVHRYLMVHKPTGVLTTVTDPFDRPTIIDLVRHYVTEQDGRKHRLFPIGRLDLDSEGLLLLTDDGQLAHLVAHPSVGLEKEYRVLVRGDLNEGKLEKLRSGVMIEGQITAPAIVEIIRFEQTDLAWLRFIVHEGRKRQVRRMSEAMGLHPLRLIRVRIGPLVLGSLKTGQYRELTYTETNVLRTAVGLRPLEAPQTGDEEGHVTHDSDRRA